MASANFMTGSITLSDGTTHEWRAGARERILAERHLKLTVQDLRAEAIGEEYVVVQVFASLQRDGVLPREMTFDTFLLEHFRDYEVVEDPELETPPGN